MGIRLPQINQSRVTDTGITIFIIHSGLSFLWCTYLDGSEKKECLSCDMRERSIMKPKVDVVRRSFSILRKRRIRRLREGSKYHDG